MKDHTYTREEAYAISMKNAGKIRRMTPAQEAHALDTNHRVRGAYREKLGLPIVGAGPNVQESYRNLNSGVAVVMGTAAGLMYHYKESNPCFAAIEGTLISFDTFTIVIAHLYLPWYWADFQVVLMDTTTLMSSLYSKCEIDKFLTTSTKFITIEGLSELGSRALGAIFFEYADLIAAFHPELGLTPFEKGIYVGRAIAVTFAWTI